MKVYVVFGENYNEGWVEKVFINKELANKFILTIIDNPVNIENKYYVDEYLVLEN
nr:hypothetical protein [Clostridioides sp.]